jgi:hypothetical protein
MENGITNRTITLEIGSPRIRTVQYIHSAWA